MECPRNDSSDRGPNVCPNLLPPNQRQLLRVKREYRVSLSLFQHMGLPIIPPLPWGGTPRLTVNGKRHREVFTAPCRSSGHHCWLGILTDLRDLRDLMHQQEFVFLIMKIR